MYGIAQLYAVNLSADPQNYSSDTGSASCSPCPAGSDTRGSANGRCQVCPSGTTTWGKGDSCAVCSDGSQYYSSSSSSKPNGGLVGGLVGGVVGLLVPSPDLPGKCWKCPTGYASTGGRDCQKCAAGTYAEKDGMGTCTACPAGSAQPEEGQKSCDACPVSRLPHVHGMASTSSSSFKRKH